MKDPGEEANGRRTGCGYRGKHRCHRVGGGRNVAVGDYGDRSAIGSGP